MDSSVNKENNARSAQEHTAKRLSVDANNSSTLQAARPVLQEIETLPNDRVLTEVFETSVQSERKDITFVDIRSNITTDPFFSPNTSYDPLGTCSQSENFDRNSLVYTATVEEDLFYSIEYVPENQSKTIPCDNDQNVTFDTTESSRIFGGASNSCYTESFSDISHSSEKVKDSTVNLDPHSLNVTFEKTPASSSNIVTEMEVHESTFNTSQKVFNVSEVTDLSENVENSSENCNPVQIVNEDCSKNIFNPFESSTESSFVDDEIKLQKEEAEVKLEDRSYNQKELECETANLENEDESNPDLLDVEILKNDKEAEILAENNRLDTVKQEIIETLKQNRTTSPEKLNVTSVKQTESAIECSDSQHESQVDGVITDHINSQTEESAINKTSTITPSEETESPSIFSQIEDRVIPTVENDLESKKELEALSQSMSESIDSARVTELDSTEQVLNKTIENVKEPVTTKVHCRPNIRSLRQKTQVITNPLIVKSVDKVITDLREQQFKEKEIELKNELDKLQVELTEIQKENEVKDKRILANALAMEVNRDILAKYKTTVSHYQTFASKQSSDLLTLKVDTQELEKEFSNMEMAFADVFNKYEKAKLTIATFKQNEETLNKNIEGVEKHVDYMDQKCKELQNKYEQTVKQVQDRVKHEREANQSKLLNLRTSVKRLEIMASSLETALKQKTEECQALAAFCEDMGKI